MASPHTFRFRHLVAGLAIVVGGSACSGTTPVANVTPDVVAACDVAQDQLDALVGDEPSSEVTSAAGTALFGIFRAMPDVTTEIGRPRTLIGDEIQSMRNRLSGVQEAARVGDPDFDAVRVEGDLRAAFARLNEAAVQFDVAQCLDTEILESVLVPQIARATIAAEAVAPTGNFEVDVVAVCERFREREAQLLANHATDQFANALLVGRLKQLGRDLEGDLERLDPPADRQADVDALLATLDNFRASLESAQNAQFVSQEALDEAVEQFDRVNAQLVDRLEALSPGC